MTLIMRPANDDLFTDNAAFLDVSFGMLRSDAPDPRLADLRCGCGSSDIVALRPGMNSEDGLDRNPLTNVESSVPDSVPDVGWCAKCHALAFPALNKREVADG